MVMEETDNICLLNSGVPTHQAGGRLDLTFVSRDLGHCSKWWIHPTLTSDHYAIRISLELRTRSYVPRSLPGWEFESHLNGWHNKNKMGGDLDANLTAFTNAVNKAAEKSIPRKRTGARHRDYWFYCDEIREQNRRIDKHRKLHRRNPTAESLSLLREVIWPAKEISRRVKAEKWYEWCSTIDEHSKLREIWRNINIATGRMATRPPACLDPLEDAERLNSNFAARAATTNILMEIQDRLQQLRDTRQEKIDEAVLERDETDGPFTLDGLLRARKKSKDMAPGNDGITYSIISGLGTGGHAALLTIMNESWGVGRLPLAWKKADILPIPKPKEKGKY
ncbi:hypothetical protein Pcinc_018575 [Petrolisthes cinctipes]|uniref:Endonuclease/exonuclease/phosphatase domain-containing protein n=1 Tax=Petrolisthes cinctipes TaxID=88211 RepID=A0AAE1FN86_PETCI|nr:hypothetical protein Pcinc_018575 [Petrolisthes cinctipes]